jgi:drug/metabolite transporter (DMT)-like permease
MRRNRLTLKILLLLVFTDILETFTQLCFKKTSLAEGNVVLSGIFNVLEFIRTAACSPFLWLGLASVFLTFVIWSSVLSKIDLSIAVPIASSSYILVPLASIIFFHETLSFLRWIGIFFIIAGVILVSLTSHDQHHLTA